MTTADSQETKTAPPSDDAGGEAASLEANDEPAAVDEPPTVDKGKAAAFVLRLAVVLVAAAAAAAVVNVVVAVAEGTLVVARRIAKRIWFHVALRHALLVQCWAKARLQGLLLRVAAWSTPGMTFLLLLLLYDFIFFFSQMVMMICNCGNYDRRCSLEE